MSGKSGTDATSKLEKGFKVLMEATGATNSKEVHALFIAQKEAGTRLNYLRTVTEAEKKHLETQRDQLMSQMDGLKIYDTKEAEVYGTTNGMIKHEQENKFQMFVISLTEIKSWWRNYEMK